eukprot:2685656-Prymnesium_polylepis.1
MSHPGSCAPRPTHGQDRFPQAHATRLAMCAVLLSIERLSSGRCVYIRRDRNLTNIVLAEIQAVLTESLLSDMHHAMIAHMIASSSRVRAETERCELEAKRVELS